MAKEKEATKEQTTKEFFDLLDKKFAAYFEPDVFKTGIVPLDLALNGGLETGSLIELAGESQCGKSTLVLHLVKNMAEKGYKTLYIDAEGSVKEDMLKGIGLLDYLATKSKKNNMLTVIRQSGFRAVEELFNAALKTKEYKIFVIDSLTALVDDAQIDTKNERSAIDTRLGLQAQLTSNLLRKLNALKTEYNCIFICINQTRNDFSNSFMVKAKSTGGKAVEFYPDVRLFMRVNKKIFESRQLIIGETEVPIGASGTIEAIKSRVGAGFIKYPITVYYGKGINNLTAYEALLPTFIDKKTNKPVLEKLSTVSYALHLPSGDDKTTGGANGLHTLIHDHYNEIAEVTDMYLEEYFNKVKNNEIETSGEIYRDVEHDLEVVADDSISMDYSLLTD